MKIQLSHLIAGFLVLWLCPHYNQAARILGFFPTTTKSHMLIHCTVANTLAVDGHEVTILGSIPNVLKNFKYKYIHIDIPDDDEDFTNSLVDGAAPAYKRFPLIILHTAKNTNLTLNHPKMKEFLNTNKAGDFDLMIFGYFVNDFAMGLGGHFRCPIVISFMVQTVYPLNKMLGNPSEMSYVPTLFSGWQQPMDFMKRLGNFLATIFEQRIWAPWIYKLMGEYYQYNFPADRYPPLEDVLKNVSLVLTNHHFSQGPIRPNVPALIEIGGIQIKETPDALPEELAQIMDSAENGVIFFSLGSNVQGSNLSKDKAKMIFNVLSKLPYTILLKWGDSDVPGKSSNIIYKNWLPQDDVLAHPKLKLFVTHGGQGSVVESQYHGVPMVGIPFFGDQHSNMANVKKSGFGLTLDYNTMTEEDMRSAILEVLNNPLYRNNVQTFSKLYRDRPMTPRQLVRYWVDYVIRHNGAKHLQSPAVFMNWWQINSVDVIAFLLAIVFGVVGILVGLCKCLCCRGKNAAKKPVAKSKKNK